MSPEEASGNRAGAESSSGNYPAVPVNSVNNRTLQVLELAFFCCLILLFCAATAWGGVGFLLAGDAVFPLIGLTLPSPAGYVAGGFCLALAGVIAAGTLAMWVRFR